MGTGEYILLIVGAYSAIGIAFAAAFVTLGIARVDQGAKGAGWAFLILMIPGTAALWPLMLIKWVRSRTPRSGT